jgi:hypothetical protein
MLEMPEPRGVPTEGVNAFLSVKVAAADCAAILAEAEKQISLVHEAPAACRRSVSGSATTA